MNYFAKTVKAIDTKLEDYVQTLVCVNLVDIRTGCMLRRLRNDARRQVPSEFLNVYKRGSISSIYPKLLQSTCNDVRHKMCEFQVKVYLQKKSLPIPVMQKFSPIFGKCA